jgi:hypothetical protein
MFATSSSQEKIRFSPKTGASRQKGLLSGIGSFFEFDQKSTNFTSTPLVETREPT